MNRLYVTLALISTLAVLGNAQFDTVMVGSEGISEEDLNQIDEDEVSFFRGIKVALCLYS